MNLNLHFATPDEELPLLEKQLPAFHVLLPLIRNSVNLSSPQFVCLMQGANLRGLPGKAAPGVIVIDPEDSAAWLNTTKSE